MAKVIGKWRWNDDVHESIWTVTVPKYTQNVNFITSRDSAPFVCESIYFATSSDAIQILYSGAYENKSFAAMILYSDGREPLIVEEMLTMDFGDTEQEVSDDFYNVLVTCATPATSTIAKKLVLLRNNQPRVYHAGYDKGLIDGKQAEYDAFWDAYQDNGNRVDYIRGYCGRGWNEATFKPKYDIKPIGSAAATWMFRDFNAGHDNRMNLTKDSIGVEIDLSGATGANEYVFYSANIDELDTVDVSNMSGFQYGFAYSRIIKIKKFIVSETTGLSNAFYMARSLTEITVEGVIGKNVSLSNSTLLSRASIVSIITHLSDTASGNTVTLSKTAVDKACAEAELSDRINSTNSAWWAWLIGTKPNWTISLV